VPVADFIAPMMKRFGRFADSDIKLHSHLAGPVSVDGTCPCE
jgi:hypothetical protein